jgi:hypothetical protein
VAGRVSGLNQRPILHLRGRALALALPCHESGHHARAQALRMAAVAAGGAMRVRMAWQRAGAERAAVALAPGRLSRHIARARRRR